MKILKIIEDLIPRLIARIFPDHRTWVERVLILAGITALTQPVWVIGVKVIFGVDIEPSALLIGSGVILLGAGIGLHLYNRRHSVERQVPDLLSDRDIADKRVLVNVFNQLHLPTIDGFLECGKRGMIFIPALPYIDSLAEIVDQSSFYLHDSRFHQGVLGLKSSLMNAVSKDEFFVQMPNENLHRFDNLRSVHSDHEAQRAFELFNRSVHDAEINLRSLMEAVRLKFPDFDFEATDRHASSLTNYN